MRIELDVSELQPIEPLERILDALPSLQAGDWLDVRHRQQPYPLYNLLREGGFAWRVRSTGPARFEIQIWRQGDAEAEAQVERIGA